MCARNYCCERHIQGVRYRVHTNEVHKNNGYKIIITLNTNGLLFKSLYSVFYQFKTMGGLFYLFEEVLRKLSCDGHSTRNISENIAKHNFCNLLLTNYHIISCYLVMQF